MSHKSKKITRFLQKHTLYIMEQIRFKTAHITQGGKITLIGTFICFFSLFQPWIDALESIVSSRVSPIVSVSSFSWLVWYVGVFILLTLGLIIFSLFSIRKKEKFHFFSLIHIYDDVCAFYGSLFMIILCLQTFLFIGGLQVFSWNILYGKWIMLCITWSVIMLFWSFLLKKEHRKNIKGSYMSELRGNDKSRSGEEEKNNMKLPF